MKKIILIAIVALFTINVWGQTYWELGSDNKIYYNDGNVGIGTTTPTAKLSLGEWNLGSSGEQNSVQMKLSGLHNDGNNNIGTKLLIEGYNNDGPIVYPIYLKDENQFVDFWIRNRLSQSGLPLMFFAGQVGIGTASPSERLSLYTNTSIQVASQYGNSNTGEGSGNGFVVGIEGSGNGLVWNRENNFIRLGTNAQERMRILANGNVGIGTITPTEKLEVNGDILGDQYRFKSAYYDFSASPRTQLDYMSIKLFDDYITYRPGGVAPGDNNYGTLLSIYGKVNHWEHNLYFGANKKLYFRTSTWTGGSSENGTGEFNDWRIILDSKSAVESSGNLKITGSENHYILYGNVGIGTTIPDYKLTVKGTIGCEEVKVEIINSADFVFEENYELRKLDELEEFVKTNKHLPEIASEKEMKENGVDMGGFQIQLLQKIEELTLYVIELKKENEAQKLFNIELLKIVEQNNHK